MIEMADGMVQLHTGDAREVLRSLPAESVQCVVTSHPYWSLRDYGVPPSIWGGMPSCSHAWGPHGTLHKGGSQGATGVRADRDATQIELTGDLDVGCFCQECGAWFGCLGLEPTPWMFVDHIVEVFAEVHRVLKPDGCLFFNMGDVFATGAYSARIAGGGEQGARWMGDIGRHRDTYRRNPTANRSVRDPRHAGKHTGMVAMGPMSQPNRQPLEGLKPKDLVGIPWMCAFALRDFGYWLRMDNIWSKPNPMPSSASDRTTSAHEYVFHMAKGQNYFYDKDAISEPASEKSHPRGNGVNPKSRTKQDQLADAKPNGGRTTRGFNERCQNRQNASFSAAVVGLVERRNKRSVWEIPPEPFREAHYATMPTELARICTLAGSRVGDSVLDPFGGAGTVALTAWAHERVGIHVDLSPEYTEIARLRIERAMKRGRHRYRHQPVAPRIHEDQHSLFPVTQ